MLKMNLEATHLHKKKLVFSTIKNLNL